MSDVEASDWAGLVSGARPNSSTISLVVPLQQSSRGGSGAFLGRASDNQRYWIKPLNSPQGSRVAATEQIVATAGHLIAAPVCTVEVINIPAAIAASGWKFKGNKTLVEGCAHGSLDLAGTVEEHRKLNYRERDDNSIRHAGYYALYDWCWGQDPQGLLALSDDRRFYSHDHGHFFPKGPKWTKDSLLAHIDTARPFSSDIAGLDQLEILALADRLECVTRDQILEVVTRIPQSWPILDEELETVGFFLERRAPSVAERLRQYF